MCLLLAGSLASFVWRPGGSSFRLTWAVLLVTALVLHLFTEGPHWQMAPAYLSLTLILFAIVSARGRGLSLLQLASVLILTLFTPALSWVLPMFTLPAPTGAFDIGTRILNLRDSSRAQDGGEAAREIVVQVWYPAVRSNRPLAPYRRWAETTLLSSYQAVLWTHARQNAPVLGSGAPFPVVLFSPAWGGRRTQDTFLIEDLVSHGYAVAAVDHPHNSGPMKLSDGRVLPPVSSSIGDVVNDPPDELRRTGDKESSIGAADLIFVLDALESESRSASSAFYGRLDTNRAGAFGQSFGGSRSVQACLLEPRIRSSIDLDGWLFGGVRNRPLMKPLMVIQEDEAVLPADHRKTSSDILDNEYERILSATFSMGGGYRIFLHGSTHPDFTDRPFFSPLHRLSGNGAIAPQRIQAILRQYIVAFFDQTLKNRPSSLLKAPASPFPEATMRVFPSKSESPS